MSYILQHYSTFRPYMEMMNALASALSIITWLIAVPVVIWAWRRSREIRLNIFGLEATFRQGIEAAVAIGAATAEHSASQGEQRPNLRPGVVADVLQTVWARTKLRLSPKSVLWVDDRPENNKYEQRALQAIGSEIIVARSTSEALQKLAERRFDLVISDMRRPSDELAGYALLAEMRQQGRKEPVILYTARVRPEDGAEGAQRGALAVVDEPQELLKQAVHALFIAPRAA